MKIDQKIALLNDLFSEHIGNPLTDCPLWISGKNAVQVLPIKRIIINDPLLKSRDVRDVDHYQGSGERPRIDLLFQPVESQYGWIFVAVDSCNKSQHFSLLRTMDYGHGNERADAIFLRDRQKSGLRFPRSNFEVSNLKEITPP